MNKPITVGQLIEILKDYDQGLPIAFNDRIMGWVNGIELQQDTLYRKPKDKSNKYYMLFEDDKKKRTKQSVLKLTGFYISDTRTDKRKK